MLTDPKTFSKLVQVLLFPSRHLVAAVMPVIQVVLSKNDPMTIRTALRSGLLYLMLLGLKHILENDSEVKVIEPNARDILWPSGTFESSKNDTHSSTAASDVSLAGTGAGGH